LTLTCSIAIGGEVAHFQKMTLFQVQKKLPKKYCMHYHFEHHHKIKENDTENGTV